MPAVSLGQPVRASGNTVLPVAWTEKSQTSQPAPADLAALLPWVPRMTVRAQAPEEVVTLYGPPPVPPPNPNASPFPPGNVPPPPPDAPALNQGVAVDQPINNSFWNKCADMFGGVGKSSSGCNGHCFQSDHAFDGMYSTPMSSPFFFIDPRSLTEIRPIYIYQTIPNGNPLLNGGNAQFFGFQGSVAFNEMFSLVINKLGWVSLRPDNVPFPYQRATGFAELWLGPKVTFLRAPGTGTCIAGGLTFQIPTGSSQVFQSTGNLSLDPYISFAQNLPVGKMGSFNFMNTTGIAFSVNSKRTDYFHTHFHLDYDVINAHVFYPFIEFNWFQYFTNGNHVTQSFEGADLFNFGATNVSGQSFTSLGTGFRYKIWKEFIQAGVGVEWGLRSTWVENMRFTVDLIFRY